MKLKQFFSRAPAPARASGPGESRVSRLLLPWAEWLTRFPQWSRWDAEKAVREGFQASPWVYAAIKRRADAVASVPWEVQIRKGDGTWEQAPDSHPLAKLLARPNPEMSLSELVELTQIHLDLAGNAFWHKAKVGDGEGARTKYVYPVMPERVRVVPGTLTIIDGYIVGNAPGVRLPAGDIVHFAYANPGDLLYGQSPLQAAGKSVDVDNAAAAWQKVSMQNRGIPDGIFEMDDADMTPDQFEEVRKVIREQYAGIGNARTPWVVNRAKWRPMSLSPAEVDFIETRHLSMKEICAVYGVPSEMISGMGDANRASSETVRKTFWLDTILPLLTDMQATLNRGLAEEYGGEVRIAYNTSSVPALQENRAEVMKVARDLWAMGVPFNEINQRLGLGFDDIPGGDVGYLSAGLIPADFDFGELIDAGGEVNAEEAGRKAYGTPTR